MSIRNIEQAKVLKEYCSKLGREGMYEKVVQLAREIIEFDKTRDFVEIMGNAGKIRAITTGSQCDYYFGEKVDAGFQKMYWEANQFNHKK